MPRYYPLARENEAWTIRGVLSDPTGEVLSVDTSALTYTLVLRSPTGVKTTFPATVDSSDPDTSGTSNPNGRLQYALSEAGTGHVTFEAGTYKAWFAVEGEFHAIAGRPFYFDVDPTL